MPYLNQATVEIERPGACVTIVLPTTPVRKTERHLVIAWSDDDLFEIGAPVKTPGRRGD